MYTAIFHSVNSGLFFWDGANGLLLDGVHRGREEGCSPMPEFLSMQLRCGSGLFAHLTGMLFTHLHADHFDHAGVKTLLCSQPNLPVSGPGLRCGAVLVRHIRSSLRSIRMGGAYILARDTVHDGTSDHNAPHRSYLLRMGGESFFIAGDAVLRGQDAVDFAGFYSDPVAAAFCNLYQLASREGQDFLRALSPKRIFLYHLPLQEDDQYHYQALARQALKLFPADLPRPVQLRHMSWIDGQAADWDVSVKDARVLGPAPRAQKSNPANTKIFRADKQVIIRS